MKVLREPCDNDKSKRKLYAVAQAVVQKAIAGDMTAALEIGNRLDGRSIQPVSGADGQSPIEMVIRWALAAQEQQPIDVTPASEKLEKPSDAV